MKKWITLVGAAILTFNMAITALAAPETISYYDESGNNITVNGMYYNNQGYPMYNANCYYLNGDGEQVSVGGCRAYYYDSQGTLAAGSYYYDINGTAVARPASYPEGYGCGMFYYDNQGTAVNQLTYYDDFGNPVALAQTEQPPAANGWSGSNGNGGYGGGYCRGGYGGCRGRY